MRLRPAWIIVAACIATACAGLGVWYWLTAPTVLRLAVGNEGREHARLMNAFAQKLTAEHAAVRLKLVRNQNLVESAAMLDAHEADVAVVRSDHMPRDGLTLAILNRSAIVFVAPAGSRLRRVADLRGHTVGVLRGATDNTGIFDALLAKDKLDRSHVRVVSVTYGDLQEVIDTHRVDAIMVASPIQSGMVERVLTAMTTGTGPRSRPVLFGVEDAEALAAHDQAFDATDLPRGTFGTDPAWPAEDLSTVSITQRLVASRQVRDGPAGDLTRLLFTMRTALAAQIPSANAIEALDPDDAATVGLHPGARQYYSGEQQTFIERYSDFFYIGITLLTMVASAIGGLWSYLLSQRQESAVHMAHRLLKLQYHARLAADAEVLDDIEAQADELLGQAVTMAEEGRMNGSQFHTFAVLNQSLLAAIAQRHARLAAARGSEHAGAVSGDQRSA